MRIKIRWLFIGLLLAILVATYPLQNHVRAQARDQYVVLSPPLSLGPGQFTQFTLFTPDGIPVRAEAKVIDEHNRTILESPVAAIPAGAPYTWTYTHGQVADETRTARVHNFRVFILATAPSSQKINAFVVSIATINDSTHEIVDGTSQTLAVGEYRSGFNVDQTHGTITQNYMVSVVPGEPVLITIFNPAQATPYGELVTFTATITPISGSAIATSPVITIPSDEFRTVSLDTTNWPIDGATGLANVRITTIVSAASGRDPLNIKRFAVLDPNTLNTTWEAGDQCLVFFLAGR